MPDDPIHLSRDAGDWALALGLVAAWLIVTIMLFARRSQAAVPAAQTIVVHASQTGHASDLAQQAQLRIEASGTACALVEADNMTSDLLATARLLLFVASTTGEGDAPDNARRFVGARRYGHFGGFGRRIAEWAREGGAELLFPCVEVDDLGAADLAVWDMRLAEVGYPASAAPAGEVEPRWHVATCERVAGPSRDREGGLASDGLFRIALRPAEGGMPDWEIGDLFELRTPDGHVRDYSIASLPGEDAILLFVRRVVCNGIAGVGSGHLTHAEPGSASIVGRVRTHRSFHPPTGEGPLLAIGAGSGWSGLRPHLLHAMALAQPCRLVFGERAAEADSPILGEMRGWQSAGRLDRLDLALSQPGEGGPYVQDILLGAGADIAEFLGAAGRIVICGRLAMGERCLAGLAASLGEDWLDRAREEGRLLRDLY